MDLDTQLYIQIPRIKKPIPLFICISVPLGFDFRQRNMRNYHVKYWILMKKTNEKNDICIKSIYY